MAIIGVGQSLMGDDGAGPAVIRQLTAALPHHDNLLLVDGGHAPENCLGLVIRFRPDIVLFIDAIRNTTSPGSICCLKAADAEDIGGSTHTLSLSRLAAYLALETSADTYIIGIQAANTSFGEGLTTEVIEAVGQIANTIADYWRRVAAASSAINVGDISVART